MASDHADDAVTIRLGAARKLLAQATPKGRRLLELFARQQLVGLEELREEFGVSQNGLNALLGHLTLVFQEIQAAPGFYIYIPAEKSWAIGHASGINLRRAIKDDEESRQARLRF